MRILATLAATGAALATLISPAHADPGTTHTIPVRSLLNALPIADETRAGYQREAFKHWVDADKDGCSTRNEVLLEEAVNAPQVTGRCTLTGGTWYSPYDDTYVDGARGLDIDHLVPLAESWDSGAGEWTAAEREAYANDLDDHRALIAVTARSNRSKADQDPATWQPPAEAYRCQYFTDWVTIKTRWGLAIDPAEQATLSELADECPNTPVTFETAR
ncbi:HNH endonuclease family protein [Streptomyces lancefieldiae]|uniref:HNH endonuclease family protein n=1 Tax=Streptomyces lancefieldiae TaxID=3075520 RepID=A0ABU3AFW1_9ACTN|nr:HNH endonuclease family protein [Streptomyces sp. DSM 40712]MDT0608823.1 HNH endonuclease family protein [Streptomyces sp. DSM 40712]